MKIYTFLFLLALTAMSCSESFLDVAPKDALSPSTFWKTEQDVQLALTGCYNGFESGSGLMYRECGSDNGYNNFPWEGWTNIGNGSVTAANPGSNYFGYSTIYRCNEFLTSLGEADIPGIDLTVYEAQARFIRAYKYYQMVVNHGDVPLITVNFDHPDEAKIPRDPKETVIKFIEDELTTIIDILPESYPQEDFGKATKGAAQALLMRMKLYYGKYQEALTVAKSIEGYELHPDYITLFNPDNEQNKEVIMSVQYTPDLYSLNYTPFLPNGSGGWSSVVPTQQLVDSYEMANGLTIDEALVTGDYDPQNPYKDRDPRLRATIIYPGQMWQGEPYRSVEKDDVNHYQKANNSSKTGYNFRKYLNYLNDAPDAQYWNSGADIFIFRYAEVLLTIAEAKIELGQIDDELYKALDDVRTRAGMPAVDRVKYNTADQLRMLLQNERRVEFAMEGLRRDDIIRWEIAPQVMSGIHKGVKEGVVLESQMVNGDHNVLLDQPQITVETRTFEAPKNYLLPIPQSAIDKNPNLLPNNTGF
ncbi:Starch-binding associating with outer membrane [Saccharicrinis carchari]|uniref:Starch-binding associating with outer membrane n=1 Tax=Saccharicrinis carchari TaxID=1168039 RepID=A0A521ABP6_SACCC|nr:RagB/SusD family nutrient uptake outer membrane protein [Saccharicrinis carchari]SMO32150.1 Starch-binding associating with outer membrane [Saccharicrinis carchari]